MSKDEKEPRPSYLPSNSKTKNGREKKDIQPVANGKLSKKPLDKKFKEAFLGEDAQNVKSYLVWDVLIPAAKDMVADLVKKGIDAILYGKAKPPENVKRERGSSYVSYNSKYRGRYETLNDPPWRVEPRRPSYNRRAAHKFDDIDFDTREEAEGVLSAMADILDEGMPVNVADFYTLCNVPHSWTDNEYGWYDVSGVIIMRNAFGRWYLDLPRPVSLVE